MKIYVGCGKDHKEGYKHCDIGQYPHIDYLCPAWNIPIPPQSMDEIYSRHLLEHLDITKEIPKTLQHWWDRLKVGGRVRVIVPNLEYHCKQIFKKGKSPYVESSNFVHAMSSIYGWQNGNNYMQHKWGYTPDTLKALFKACGYKKIKLLKSRACDIDLEAYK